MRRRAAPRAAHAPLRRRARPRARSAAARRQRTRRNPTACDDGGALPELPHASSIGSRILGARRGAPHPTSFLRAPKVVVAAPRRAAGVSDAASTPPTRGSRASPKKQDARRAAARARGAAAAAASSTRLLRGRLRRWAVGQHGHGRAPRRVDGQSARAATDELASSAAAAARRRPFRGRRRRRSARSSLESVGGRRVQSSPPAWRHSASSTSEQDAKTEQPLEERRARLGDDDPRESTKPQCRTPVARRTRALGARRRDRGRDDHLRDPEAGEFACAAQALLREHVREAFECTREPPGSIAERRRRRPGRVRGGDATLGGGRHDAQHDSASAPRLEDLPIAAVVRDLLRAAPRWARPRVRGRRWVATSTPRLRYPLRAVRPAPRAWTRQGIAQRHRQGHARCPRICPLRLGWLPIGSPYRR